MKDIIKSYGGTVAVIVVTLFVLKMAADRWSVVRRFLPV